MTPWQRLARLQALASYILVLRASSQYSLLRIRCTQSIRGVILAAFEFGNGFCLIPLIGL
jgi:hypothetical protein